MPVFRTRPAITTKTPPAMNTRLLTLGLLVAAVGLAGWAAMERYSFAGGSRVWVEGTSTVHDWTCSATQVSGTLDAVTAEAGLSGLSGLTVTVPVNALDCDNGTMNGKLRDALGTAAIRFTASNARVGAPGGGRFTVETDGQLTIRGTTRAQRIQAQGQALGGGRYRFTGSVPVTMSQFGVTPPTAMLGTLRTGDRVTVRFDVTVAR
jgi:polyisoprenoid-binding protein YceI